MIGQRNFEKYIYVNGGLISEDFARKCNGNVKNSSIYIIIVLFKGADAGDVC